MDRLFEVKEDFQLPTRRGRKTINRLLRKGDYLTCSEKEGDANPHLVKVSKNVEAHYREQGSKTKGRMIR